MFEFIHDYSIVILLITLAIRIVVLRWISSRQEYADDGQSGARRWKA